MTKIKEFITRLKELREKNHLSQKEFGGLIGFSQGNIGDWERGRSQPSVKAIIAIVNQFNISSDWLLLGKENPSQDPFPLLKGMNETDIKLLNTFAEFLLFKKAKRQQPEANFLKNKESVKRKLTEEAFFNKESGN